ncbi:metallophosphoesterase [Fodinibius salsisoli]|uniref:Metallophosphoesterase n=1 Tax=Fodinibius salsisoli TaxID=2820877 RepID=A0ABT3PPJ5_9BACT|nr:metallophosphoesterase [Fodinibius salsisoli]MCW9707785.1 metallophosphoesterase [Fodinibius salsisoli]
MTTATTFGKRIIPFILCSFYIFPIAGTLEFYVNGHIDVLKYPKALTYWFWFGLIFVFQLFTWVLILDVAKLFSWLFSWHPGIIKRGHAYLLLILFGLTFIYSGWKVYHDTTEITKEEVVLQVKNLPDALEGFKVVHISDIQGDEYTGRSEIGQYVRKVNAQNPDLVLFTGDLISYGTDFIRMSAEEFGKAEATYGTYAVLGDHDYWAGTKHVEKALAEHGIPLLKDENRAILVDDSSRVMLTGITQVYSKRSKPEDVDSLAWHAKDAVLKIMASHQVDAHLIESSQKYGFDMLLAGHTHGGQIQVPFMGMDFSAAARETKYVSGLYHEGGLPINVNNGLGFTLGPIRYNAPPTITVIELQSKS